jgi:chromosome segregation ATPase
LWYGLGLSRPRANPRGLRGTGRDDLPKIQGQLLELKANEAAEHARIDQDERLIRDLERRLEQLHKDNLKLDETSEHLTAANHQLADSTTQQIQNLQERIDSGVSATQFDSAMSRYLGTHEFTVVGDAAGGFIYDRATS